MHAEAFRLHPGVDLKQELKRLVEENHWQAAFILSCIGSLSRAGIRMAGAQSTSEVGGPLEIISLGGTLAADGIHAHIAVATGDGRCIGGHLADGCIINTTVELIVCELSHLQFRRVLDEGTGFRELAVLKRQGSA